MPRSPFPTTPLTVAGALLLMCGTFALWQQSFWAGFFLFTSVFAAVQVYLLHLEAHIRAWKAHLREQDDDA